MDSQFAFLVDGALFRYYLFGVPQLSESEKFIDSARIKFLSFGYNNAYIALLWDNTIYISGNDDTNLVNEIFKKHNNSEIHSVYRDTHISQDNYNITREIEK